MKFASLTRARVTVRAGFAAALLAAAASACVPIASYDQHAYEQTTSLKVESLDLMAKATEPYAAHESEVQTLELRIREAYEYARHLPHNELTARQWQIVMNPDGHSLFGFFARWKSEGRLGGAFVKDAQGVVSDDFDQIIGLEMGKPK